MPQNSFGTNITTPVGLQGAVYDWIFSDTGLVLNWQVGVTLNAYVIIDLTGTFGTFPAWIGYVQSPSVIGTVFANAAAGATFTVDGAGNIIATSIRANNTAFGNASQMTVDVNGNLVTTGTVQSSFLTATNLTASNGSIFINAAGTTLKVRGGANSCIGTAVLNGTTAVVVATTAVTANSRIFLTILTAGGTVSSAYVSAVVAGTSFSIKATGAADTSTVSWFIMEQI